VFVATLAEGVKYDSRLKGILEKSPFLNYYEEIKKGNTHKEYSAKTIEYIQNLATNNSAVTGSHTARLLNLKKNQSGESPANIKEFGRLALGNEELKDDEEGGIQKPMDRSVMDQDNSGYDITPLKGQYGTSPQANADIEDDEDKKETFERMLSKKSIGEMQGKKVS